MNIISIYISKKSILKLLLLTSILVILSVLILVDKKSESTESVIMSWAGIVFFGSGFIIFLYKYFDRNPQINIDKHGIWKQHNQEKKLYWEQIKAIKINEANNNYFVKFSIDSSIHNKNRKHIKSVYISPLNVDKTAFVALLNNLIQSKEEKRDIIIQSFKNKAFTTAVSSNNNMLFYVFISVILFYLTRNYKIAFFAYIGVLGIASLALKWYSYSDKKPAFIKHAATVVYLGFANLALLFLSFTATKYIVKTTKSKLTNSIEQYYEQNQAYPKTLDNISKSADLNLLEIYFLDELEYQNFGNRFVLSKK